MLFHEIVCQIQGGEESPLCYLIHPITFRKFRRKEITCKIRVVVLKTEQARLENSDLAGKDFFGILYHKWRDFAVIPFSSISWTKPDLTAIIKEIKKSKTLR